MALNQKKILSFLILATFGFSSLALASKAPRGSIFSSTIEDGTPKVVHGTTQLDDDDSEEISDDTVVRSRERYVERTRERVRKAPASQPKQAKVNKPLPSAPVAEPESIPEGTEFSSSEDQIQENQMSKKPSESELALENEVANLKKANLDLADRLSQLEKAKAPAEKPAKEIASAEEALSKAPQDSAMAKKMRTAGDKIPSERIADVAERLKYANDIVKRFGIAYDYRAMTLSDFKRVLAKLESKHKSKNPNEMIEAEN